MKTIRQRLCLGILLIMVLGLFGGCSAKSDPEPVAPAPVAEPVPEEVSITEAAASIYPSKGHPHAVPDSYTIMLYLIGADLETWGGMASRDLDEIMEATIGRNVRVVVETGGSTYWHNSDIDPDKCERFVIANGRMTKIQSLERQKMNDYRTLGDFIAWARDAYPSEHYALILWDHGGGTLCGFGIDEYYPRDELSLPEIRQALARGGQRFDFIGFDACLMATLETAMSVYGYADYLIASEEVEPGSGWDYTEWLNALEENPDMNTIALGRMIVDNYVYGPDIRPYENDICLSMISVEKVPQLLIDMQQYNRSSRALMSDDYMSIAQARSRCKTFGSGVYEQVDLQDYVRRVDSDMVNAEQVMQSASAAVVYSQSKVSRAHGIAVYFPYIQPSAYGTTVSMMNEIGYDYHYFTFFDMFMTRLVNEQMYTITNDSAAGVRLIPPDYSWFQDQDDTQAGGASGQETSAFSSDNCELVTQNGRTSLRVTAQGVPFLADVMYEVVAASPEDEEDEEEPVVYGTDIRYEAQGDLSRTYFGGTWPSLDGEPLIYHLDYTSFAEEEYTGSWYAFGTVPGTVGDTDVEFVVYWGEDMKDEGTPANRHYMDAQESGYYGRVIGYYRTSQTAEDSLMISNAVQRIRGMIQLRNGDVITLQGVTKDVTLTVTQGQTVSLRYMALDKEEYPHTVRFVLHDINQTEFVME